MSSTDRLDRKRHWSLFASDTQQLGTEQDELNPITKASKAARSNASILKKLCRALHNNPEDDIASLLRVEYSAMISTRLAEDQVAEGRQGLLQPACKNHALAEHLANRSEASPLSENMVSELLRQTPEEIYPLSAEARSLVCTSERIRSYQKSRAITAIDLYNALQQSQLI